MYSSYHFKLKVLELKRTFSVARLVYNKAVELMNHGEPSNFMHLRNLIFAEEPPTWARDRLKVSYEIREGAIVQACNAFKTNIAKNRINNRNTHFKVKFRSLKQTPTEVVTFPKKTTLLSSQTTLLGSQTTLLGSQTILTSSRSGRTECLAFFGCNLKTVGGIRLQDSARIINKLIDEGKLKEDGKIQYDKRTKKFYLIYSYDQPFLQDPDPLFINKEICATDPGIDPFGALYSPTSGQYGVLLHESKVDVKVRLDKIDHLQSRIARKSNLADENRNNDSVRRSKRKHYLTTRRLKLKLSKERVRLHNWMRNGHYACANFLLSQFDIIIQPKLAVSKIVNRTTRNINSKAARRLLTWSHFKFRERLISASSRYGGKYVLETKEPGTTKTCTNCGQWKRDLRLGDKIYNCLGCGIRVDRNVAGARNNFFSEYGRALNIGWDGRGE